MSAVAYALQDGRPLAETASIAKSLCATLRAQVASHLQKRNHFEATFKGGSQVTKSGCRHVLGPRDG